MGPFRAAIERLWRYWVVVLGKSGRYLVRLLPSCPYACFTHETRHTWPAALHTLALQFSMYAWSTVRTLALVECIVLPLLAPG
jgi:hypothetical protein